VTFSAGGMAAAACSTGEQKALLIAILLGQARLMASQRGHPPLLLLDEIAAHLDDRRRQALYEALLVLGVQAWLTGTDPGLFAPFGDRAQFVLVSDARLTRN
jgi:DNA replication and repair protein RecF